MKPRWLGPAPLPAAARWGLVMVTALVVLAAAAPLLAPYPPEEQFDPVAGRYLPPLSSRQAMQLEDGRWLLAGSARVSAAGLEPGKEGETVRSLFFLLGTDQYGRDLWSRILYGARISLTIGILATALSLVLGILVGAAAALGGRWIDGVLMRFVDAMLMFPRLFLILTLAAFGAAHLWLVICILGLTGWMTTSRLIRAELLRVREAEWVLAARAIGQHPLRIFTRHMLPDALAPAIVDVALRVGAVILIEAALSFLGLGVQPPAPSWGNIIADASDALEVAWWATVFPGLAITLTVVAFNLLGDGLRDALDPRRPDFR